MMNPAYQIYAVSPEPLLIEPHSKMEQLHMYSLTAYAH
jgi:hypothetical protein